MPGELAEGMEVGYCVHKDEAVKVLPRVVGEGLWQAILPGHEDSTYCNEVKQSIDVFPNLLRELMSLCLLVGPPAIINEGILSASNARPGAFISCMLHAMYEDAERNLSPVASSFSSTGVGYEVLCFTVRNRFDQTCFPRLPE